MSRSNTSEKSKGHSSERETDYIEKLVSVNRVAKVIKGGRRFSFSALVVVGDGRGRIGHGHGKAREVPDAVKKATEQAKKSMIKIPMKEGRSLHHDIEASYGAGHIVLRSAPVGTGIIAGGPLRAVFEASGIQDVVAKSVGSSNPHNMIRAAFKALSMTASPRQVAARRGKKVSEILPKRDLFVKDQENATRD